MCRFQDAQNYQPFITEALIAIIQENLTFPAHYFPYFPYFPYFFHGLGVGYKGFWLSANCTDLEYSLLFKTHHIKATDGDVLLVSQQLISIINKTKY